LGLLKWGRGPVPNCGLGKTSPAPDWGNRDGWLP
jgi:hypothetical protein